MSALFVTFSPEFFNFCENENRTIGNFLLTIVFDLKLSNFISVDLLIAGDRCANDAEY